VSATEELWRDFHGDENRVGVTDENKVRLYFSQLGRSLVALERAIEEGTSTTNAEARAVRGFAGRLRRTFEALALKHFYPREGAELRIDTTDSGFVHWSALLSLGADGEQREAELARLPALPELKQRLLEDVVERGGSPRPAQREMLRRLYLEGLVEESLFSSFLPGELVKMGGPEDPESWFWSFAHYDRSLNRPFIYLLYFAYDGPKSRLAPGSKELEEIAAAARGAASGRTSLLAVSHRLDARLPLLRPRIVKRLALGPFHSPIFTRCEGPFGALLQRLAERLPFALHWDDETLISDRETRVGGGWLSKGQLRQVFWIPRGVDLASRGVSQLERYLLLPHWLAQHARAEGLLRGLRLLAIGRGGEVHGLD
jgi:hypothetical protein